MQKFRRDGWYFMVNSILLLHFRILQNIVKVDLGMPWSKVAILGMVIPPLIGILIIMGI